MPLAPDSSVRQAIPRNLMLFAAFTAMYAAVDLSLDRLAFSSGWTIFWPLNGVTIAILLRRARTDWPAILCGVGLGMGIGECLDVNTLGLEVWLRPISLLEVLLSALLLPAFSGLDAWLRQPRLYLRFAAALVVGPGISGILAAIVFHVQQHQPYLPAFNSWATADALGIGAMMPLALSVGSPEMRRIFRARELPRTLGILIAACAVLLFSQGASRYPLLFLVFPTLLFVDLTLSFAGSAITAAGLCTLTVYLAMHGLGQFGHWPENLFVSRDVALQIFLGFQILALFPASIVFRERRTLMEELNSSNAQLQLLASLDGLTGIANRRSLDAQLAQEWKRAIRVQKPLAMIMADVDAFKPYNDRYGHVAGDECLRLVAQVLQKTVGRSHDYVARFGGEEFVILLPHTDLPGCEVLAEKLRRAIESLQIPHAESAWGVITLSLGCSALVPKLGDDASELMRQADAALYQAKFNGRNCISASSSSIRSAG